MSNTQVICQAAVAIKPGLSGQGPTMSQDESATQRGPGNSFSASDCDQAGPVTKRGEKGIYLVGSVEMGAYST